MEKSSGSKHLLTLKLLKLHEESLSYLKGDQNHIYHKVSSYCDWRGPTWALCVLTLRATVRTYMTRAHWSTQRIVEINTRLHRISSQINSCHQPHPPSETGFVVAPKYFYCSQKTCQTKNIFTWYSCVGICDTAQTARHVWEVQPAALREEEG